MTSTHSRSNRRRMLLAFPTAVVVAAFFAPSTFAAAPIAGPVQAGPVFAAPAPTTQGIIMRDGGICDPIRHMGC